MEMGFVSDKIRDGFEMELAGVCEREAETGSSLAEEFMKGRGWEVVPFYGQESLNDLLETAMLLIRLGAECSGCKSLTLMYTEVDETLWMKREL